MIAAKVIVLMLSLLTIGCWGGGGLPDDGCTKTYSSYVSAAIGQNVKKGVPISYEWNLGQADRRYQFIARGAGMTLYLAPAESVVDIYNWQGRSAGVIHAVLDGANSKAAPQMGRAPDTLANYFIGADSSKWITDIPVYSSVRYHDVYKGIDVEYHGGSGSFEHDFIVAPRADPSQIRMSFRGADSVRLDNDGNLEISAGGERLSWRKPVLYQDSEGVRRSVAGSYRILSRGTAGIEVGPYDNSKPLVIDPIVQYLTYIGRANLDAVTRVAADSNGNLYLTGFTQDANFPLSPGAYQQNPNGAVNGNVVVAKLNAAGTAATYISHFGGATIDFGASVAVDEAGNVHLAGYTDSTDFPVTPGALKTAFTSQNPGSSHCFVTKLNAAGNALVYSTFLGGRGAERCYGIAVDGRGNAFVTGRTNSTDFPTSEDAMQRNYRGGVPPAEPVDPQLAFRAGDAFVTKLNPSGSAIVYSTFYGGSQNEAGMAIAVDAQGNAYVAGLTNSTNLPVTPGAAQTVYGGGLGQTDFVIGDAFVLKVNPTGTAAVYSTYVGGRQNEVTLGLAIDGQGSAYITGSTNSQDFPTTTQAYQTTFKGAGGEPRVVAGDIFVTKLNPAGSGFAYSTFLGGSRDDRGTAIAVDSAGNAWITGNTLSSDFPTTFDAFQKAYQGQPSSDLFIMGDAFVSQLDATGRTLKSSSYLAGNGGEAGTSIVVLPGDVVYVAGITSSSNLPVTTGAYQRSYFGTTGIGVPVGDGFVAKLGAQTSPVSVAGIASAASYAGGSVAPGEIIILAGTAIGPAALTTALLTPQGEVSRTLADTRILFDNTPAPLVYVSAAQSSAIVPYDVATKQSVSVVVEQRGNRSPAIMVPVVAAKPALFSANSSGRGQGAILNQDGSVNTNFNPAFRGSVIVLFGTGEGQTNPQGVDGRLASAIFPKPVLPVSVTIGNTRITELAYYGAAPNLVAGVFQINVVLPPNLPDGELPITVTIGSFTSQAGLTVAVH